MPGVIMKQTINGLPLMAADDGMGMSVIADFAFDEALLSDGVLQMQHAVRPELDPVRLRAELDGLATQAQTALRGYTANRRVCSVC